MKPQEKRGKTCDLNSMADFRDFIELDLIDLPIGGRKFSWYKPDGKSMSRLDRFLISPNMLSTIGKCSQLGLKRKLSDHCPILLKSDARDWGPRPFRVLNCWTDSPECKQVVEEEWKNCTIDGWAGYRCKEKLKSLKLFLRDWNKNRFGNFDEQIQQEVNSIQNFDLKNEEGDWTDNDALLRADCFAKLWKLMNNRRAVTWRQKARIDWYLKGDSNTPFFHKPASFRRKRNYIEGLNIQGKWTEDPTEIKSYAIEYFKTRFKRKDGPNLIFPDLRMNTLSEADRTWLEQKFTKEEIKSAVWECSGDKAPGPDGFNFTIIKHLWNTISVDIEQFIKEFHSNGRLVQGINSSFIVLVPKKTNPLSLDDYRPISLINSLYKILAKCLANRLRQVIHKLINPSQSAFISGRNITDSIVACNEMVDLLKHRSSGNFLFKVDFEKAFDCVHWDFLMEMMMKMGFGEVWRKFMDCYS